MNGIDTDIVRSGLSIDPDGPSYTELEAQLEAALLVINAAGASAETRAKARWDNPNALDWADAVDEVFERSHNEYLRRYPKPPALASPGMFAEAFEEIESVLAYAELHSSGGRRLEIGRIRREMITLYEQCPPALDARSQILSLARRGLSEAWSGMWEAKERKLDKIPEDFKRLYRSAQEQLQIITLLQSEREI